MATVYAGAQPQCFHIDFVIPLISSGAQCGHVMVVAMTTVCILAQPHPYNYSLINFDSVIVWSGDWPSPWQLYMYPH